METSAVQPFPPFELVQHHAFIGVADGGARDDRRPRTEVLSFGSPHLGALGRGLGDVSPAPTPIPKLARRLVTDITASSQASGFLLESGELLVAGLNDEQQLAPGNEVVGDAAGDGGVIAVPTPIEQLSTQRVVTFSIGEAHSAVINSAQTLLTFGSNEFRALGHSSDAASAFRILPRVPRGLGAVKVVQVSCGPTHSLVLSRDGAVYAMGSGSRGALGVGSPDDVDVPTRIPALEGIPMTSVVAGDSFSLAVSATGQAWSWGSNRFGQLGLPSHKVPQAAYSPMRVSALPELVQQAATGANHSAWITRSGRLYVCGLNKHGQLGLGFPAASSPAAAGGAGAAEGGAPLSVCVPTQVLLGGLAGVRVREVALGSRHTLALTVDSVVYAFGDATDGALGITLPAPAAAGAKADTPVAGSTPEEGAGDSEEGEALPLDLQWARDGCVWAPTIVPALSRRGVFRIAAGGDHSLALRVTRGSVLSRLPGSLPKGLMFFLDAATLTAAARRAAETGDLAPLKALIRDVLSHATNLNGSFLLAADPLLVETRAPLLTRAEAAARPRARRSSHLEALLASERSDGEAEGEGDAAVGPAPGSGRILHSSSVPPSSPALRAAAAALSGSGSSEPDSLHLSSGGGAGQAAGAAAGAGDARKGGLAPGSVLFVDPEGALHGDALQRSGSASSATASVASASPSPVLHPAPPSSPAMSPLPSPLARPLPAAASGAGEGSGMALEEAEGATPPAWGAGAAAGGGGEDAPRELSVRVRGSAPEEEEEAGGHMDEEAEAGEGSTPGGGSAAAAAGGEVTLHTPRVVPRVSLGLSAGAAVHQAPVAPGPLASPSSFLDSSGVDVVGLEGAYAAVLQTFSSEVTLSLIAACSAVLDEVEPVAARLEDADSLRCFLPLLLMPVHSKPAASAAVVARLCATILALPQASRALLVAWLGCDVPGVLFGSRIVKPLQAHLSYHLRMVLGGNAAGIVAPALELRSGKPAAGARGGAASSRRPPISHLTALEFLIRTLRLLYNVNEDMAAKWAASRDALLKGGGAGDAGVAGSAEETAGAAAGGGGLRHDAGAPLSSGSDGALGVHGAAPGALVPFGDFYNTDMSSLPNALLQQDWLRWRAAGYKRSVEPGHIALCGYPFLLDPGAKRRILLFEAQLLQQSEAQNALARSFMTESPYLVLEVRRSHMLSDTLNSIARCSRSDLRKPLKVIISGEEAIDAGGVRKELLQIVMREILERSGLFTSFDKEGGAARTLWFNPAMGSGAETDAFLVGVLFGLAIYNDTLLEARFPVALYRMLLGQELGLSDLAEVYPALADGLQKLLDYPHPDVEDVFCLTWEATVEAFGESNSVELVPGGKDRAVTAANKAEYARRMADFYLRSSIAAHAREFQRGFVFVLNTPTLGLFRAEELKRLVEGEPHLDFAALREATTYEGGYHRNHPMIQAFWRVVEALPELEKEKLLLFATGCSQAPIGGLARLPFKIQRAGPDSENLPTASTCFNILLLPQYDSEGKLREKLLKAISECAGFGLK